MFRKRSGSRALLVGVLSAAMAVGMLGYGQSAAPAANTKPVTTIRTVLSHYPILLEYAPYYVALDKGFFTQHGVKITVVSGGGGGATLRVLSAGGVDLAQGGFSAALLAAMKDPNVELIAGYEDINEFSWIVPQNSKVHSVKDLAGAKLAFSQGGSATDWTIHTLVRRAHIPNVTFVSCGGAGACWAAAKSGAITAAWSTEPLTPLREQKEHARVVLRAADYIKHYVLDGIDVNKQFADTHTQAVKGFLAALQEGIDFVQAHPNQAAQISAKHLKMPVAVVTEGLKDYYAISKTPWLLNLFKDKAAVDTVEQGMIDEGFLKHTVDISTVFNPKFLPAEALK